MKKNKTLFDIFAKLVLITAIVVGLVFIGIALS